MKAIAKCLMNPRASSETRMVISEEVSKALKNNQPIVALESTIITHGMDYPVNLQTALDVEDSVRKNGAIPATIAIIKGVIRVGLSKDDIEFLAKLKREDVRKCSKRDLAYVLAHKEHGSTTVAATMYCAGLAGIEIFATGGIGGVHRGAETTFDISADLVELSSTPVAVVSAGIKSILDIPKTLELLETLGVPVISYGSEYFPDFYTESSGLKAPFAARSPEECAKIISEGKILGLRNGVLIGVPIPKDKSADSEKIKAAIAGAVAESIEKGITGAKVTPFLLKKVADLTGGESVKSNIELIKNNAKVAACISVKLSELKLKSLGLSCVKVCRPRIVFCGGIALDVIGRPKGLIADNSNIGTIDMIRGGCCRDVLECVTKLGISDSLLISAVGNDLFGKMLLDSLTEMNQRIDGIYQTSAEHTAIYMCLMQDTTLATGVADMNIFTLIPKDHFLRFKDEICNSKVLVLDSNLSPEMLEFICSLPISEETLITFDPISREKCLRILSQPVISVIGLLKGNKQQLEHLANAMLKPSKEEAKSMDEKTIISTIFDYAHSISKGTDRLRYVIISSDKKVAWGEKSEGKDVKVFEVPVPVVPKIEIIKTGGAGDSLLGGVIYGLLEKYQGNMRKAIELGIKCAQLSIMSKENVNPFLSLEKIQE